MLSSSLLATPSDLVDPGQGWLWLAGTEHAASTKLRDPLPEALVPRGRFTLADTARAMPVLFLCNRIDLGLVLET